MTRTVGRFDDPALSVLLPVYNAERFVQAALESILNQTFPDFELLLLDDCSTDGSADLLIKARTLDPRVHYYRNTENRGITFTLNRGLNLARAPLIARMDADDVSSANRFEHQIAFLDEHPEIDLLGGGMEYIDEEGTVIGRSSPICGWENIRSVIHLRSPVPHPTWLVRRDVLSEVGGYRELVPAEDYDVLLRFLTHGKRFDNLNRVVLQHRLQSADTVRKRGLEQRKAVNYVLRLFRERQQNGSDNFSPADFEDATSTGTVPETLWRTSQQLVDRANQYRHDGHLFLALGLMALACLLSPHQMQFLWRGLWSRLRLRLRNTTESH